MAGMLFEGCLLLAPLVGHLGACAVGGLCSVALLAIAVASLIPVGGHG